MDHLKSSSLLRKAARDRRKFIKRLGVSAVTAGGLLHAPAILAKKRIRWKMVTTWPKNFPAVGTGANRLAKYIEELSDGQLKISVYGDNELVPALGVFDAVKRGTAEMGHGASYYWKGKHEATQFFAAVPFGLTAQEMNGWLKYGGGQALWDELYAPFDLKAFPAGNTGSQMGGWFKKEIHTVKDLKGLKMRMPGLGGEVVRRLGATVVNLPAGEIFQSLKTGSIDASEWVGPYNDLAFGFHKAATNYYWPGWHEPGTTLECLVNKKALLALPKSLQRVVELSCEASNNDILSEFQARNNEALQTLVHQHKVSLKRFPDSFLKNAGEASKTILNELAAKDPFSKKVYESFHKFMKQSVSWGNVAETGYGSIRASIFNA